MSVEHKFKRRSSEDGPGDIELTITIVGGHDIYRFAHMMLFGQVEFGARGRKIIAALKRRMRPGQWSYMDRSLGGYQVRGDREPSDSSSTGSEL